MTGVIFGPDDVAELNRLRAENERLRAALHELQAEPDWRQIARALHDRLRKIEMTIMAEATSEAMDAYDDAVASTVDDDEVTA